MKRILGGLVAYFMYFCVATVVAQIIMLGYFSTQVELTPETIRRMAQVAYGLEEKPDDVPIPTNLAEPDQGSIAQVVEARAMKLRDMEFREQALQTLKAEIDLQQRQLTDEVATVDFAKEEFQKQLAEWQDAERTAAIDNAVGLIAGMKAPQAKAQIMQMWERGEKDWVVSLFKSLPANSRKKIVAEFTQGDEPQDLSEIIRLLREGVPEIRLAEEVSEVLNNGAANEPVNR